MLGFVAFSRSLGMGVIVARARRKMILQFAVNQVSEQLGTIDLRTFAAKTIHPTQTDWAPNSCDKVRQAAMAIASFRIDRTIGHPNTIDQSVGILVWPFAIL